MTEKHCHFCRNEDTAEITSDNISLFICFKHGRILKEILEIGVKDDSNNFLGLTIRSST